MISLSEYKNMQSDTLPYTTDWGFTLETFRINCPECGVVVEKIKIKLNEFSNSLDLRTAGICPACNHLVNGKPIRIYKDGRMTWKDKDGWKLRKPTLVDRILEWLHKFTTKREQQ